MRPFLVAFALAALAGAAIAVPARANPSDAPLQLLQGTWRIVSAPGVFGYGGRVSFQNERVVYDPKLPHGRVPRILDAAARDNMVFIILEDGAVYRLRRETPDRYCGWGLAAGSPVVDMRTALNRPKPPFCLVRLPQ